MCKSGALVSAPVPDDYRKLGASRVDTGIFLSDSGSNSKDPFVHLSRLMTFSLEQTNDLGDPVLI